MSIPPHNFNSASGKTFIKGCRRYVKVRIYKQSIYTDRRAKGGEGRYIRVFSGIRNHHPFSLRLATKAHRNECVDDNLDPLALGSTSHDEMDLVRGSLTGRYFQRD